ncbi:MAG: zinc protease [Cyclobacteriaceae bacterium]|nr:MAG: zinc protease [Cyclobacteriaceae bacterium]
MPDRTVAPAIRQIEQVSIPQAQSTHLDNGIPLFYVNAGKQPVLRLEIIFKAGKLFEEYPGVSYLSGKMLTEGTAGHSASEVASFFDQLGAHIEVSPGFDKITLSIHLLSRHLPDLMPMLKEIISQPVFPVSELENLKQRKRQQLLVDLQKNNYLAAQTFANKIFGEQHPYGKILYPEAIERVDVDMIANFYHSYMKQNYEILVSGKVNENHLQCINNVLGTDSWNCKELNNSSPTNKYVPSKTNQEIEGSLQSSIRIGMPFISREHPDFPGTLVVNEILGGYFGSRLMRNIREDKGYTYGIHSSISCLSKIGIWAVGTDVKKAVQQQTVTQVEKEIEILQTDLVPDSELETVKNYMLGTFVSSLDTPFAIADKFKTIHYSGLGYEYFDDYLRTIRNIDSSSIRELSRQYLVRENMTTVVVG